MTETPRGAPSAKRARAISLAQLEAIASDDDKRRHLLVELEHIANEAINATGMRDGRPRPEPDFGAAVSAVALAARVTGLDTGGSLAKLQHEQKALLADMRVMAEKMRKMLNGVGRRGGKTG